HGPRLGDRAVRAPPHGRSDGDGGVVVGRARRELEVGRPRARGERGQNDFGDDLVVREGGGEEVDRQLVGGNHATAARRPHGERGGERREDRRRVLRG